MMQEGEKKGYERRLIELARQQSSFFPSGELVPHEKPDCLIPGACLGIEVTELLPQKDAAARFSGPQLSSFQEEVVRRAKECYYSRGDAPPADVLVFFKNDWTRRRDSNEMAQALATFVQANYPSGQETVAFGDLDLLDRLDGFSGVRISGRQSAWQAVAAGGTPSLTYKYLADRIAEKNQRVQAYREHLPPRWHVWLLIADGLSGQWRFMFPPDSESWRFDFDFDKVLFFSQEKGVIELQRGPG